MAELPADPLGVVGVIDETSAAKKGDRTPGVRRQYLGCVGKIDSGIVTVHVGVTAGRFQALLDAESYLPQSWAADRQRCREAGIPDDVRYRSEWRIALDQLIRLDANGVTFDWRTFDEGYGPKTPFLWVLGLVNQKFVAEVPTNFAVRTTPDGPVPAGRRLPAGQENRLEFSEFFTWDAKLVNNRVIEECPGWEVFSSVGSGCRQRKSPVPS